jgi:uncharacterized membrane protein
MLLVSTYNVYLTIHVIAAIIWVGGAAVSQVFALRAQRDPDPERMAGFARDVEFVGKTMFVPASLVLLVAGLLLVHAGDWSLRSGWLIFGLIVFLASFLVGVGFLAPESARIAKAIDQSGAGSDEARRRISRIFLVSRIELVFLLLVVIDMVIKPGAH